MGKRKWTQIDPPEYTCVRHAKSRRDVVLASFFLCSNCIDLLTKEVFNNSKPVYKESDGIKGFCAYCGDNRLVKRNYWYLCTGCERIIKSYAVERTASNFILDWWKQNCDHNECTKNIRLELTDPVKLMSVDEHKIWKQNLTSSSADFTGVDIKTGKKIFAIEMKTGRNAINKMSYFQLDVSDCDDILSFVKDLKIPSYLVHVWAIEEYDPPTFKKKALDMWWMSVFDMEQNFSHIRMRQQEQRPAAFFKRTGFHLKEEFLEHICNSEIDELNEELQKRIPKLYTLPEKF